jgi:putative transposase
MPRTARAIEPGLCQHVITRGNNRQRVFHTPEDYAAFVDLMETACQRRPLRMLAYCLMPNHIHLVVWPEGQRDVSRWMHWLLTTHVQRYHRQHGTIGRLWQGRFRTFAIEADDHLLTVMRYVERNPLRAGLVDRSESWRWSSLGCVVSVGGSPLVVQGPVDRLSNWTDWVNAPQTDAELDAIRVSVNRCAPYGSDDWRRRMAERLGLASSLRPRGRPAIARRAAQRRARSHQ